MNLDQTQTKIAFFEQGAKSQNPPSNVTLCQLIDSQRIIIYIPAILKFKINRIASIEPQSFSALISTSFFLTIKCQGLQPQMVEQLCNKLQLSFDLNQTIKFDYFSSERTDNLVKWRMTNVQLKTSITAYTFFTPFQLIQLILKVKILPVYISNRIRVKFNFLENQQEDLKISCKEKLECGSYLLAPALTKAAFFISQDFNVKQVGYYRKQKLQLTHKKFTFQTFSQYRYGSLSLSLYKQSFGYFLSISSFLVILGLLTLAIYFQQNSVSSRVSSIATIAIAFGTTLIAVRQSNKFESGFTFTEYCILFQMVGCILPLMQTLEIQSIQKYEFKWKQDRFYLMTLCFQLLVGFLVVVVVAVLNYFIWRPGYYKRSQKEEIVNSENAINSIGLVRDDGVQWSNPGCDQYISEYNKNLKSGNKIKKLQEEERLYLNGIK